MTGDGSANTTGSSGTVTNVNGIRSNVGVVSSDIKLSPEDGSASVPMEMKVTVTAPLTSASLSADGSESTVDPEQSLDTSAPVAQITSPDVTTINHSAVPVKLEIVDTPEVGEADARFSKKFSNYTEWSFRLVDTISGVGPPGTVVLVLGARDRGYGNDGESRYYTVRPSWAGIFVAETPAEGKAALKLYGKVAPDFYGAFEFTTRPTLKTSIVRTNETADSYRK